MFPLWLIIAFPLIGFAVNGLAALVTARNERGPSVGLSGFVSVAACGLSFVTALGAFVTLNSLEPSGATRMLATAWTWLSLPNGDLSFGLAFDRLTAVMLLFITGIGTLIHIYSIGYMREDRGFARFMAYLNLFMASMLVLVLGSSLPVTFLGWEGVGLCSYLLIGFWKEDLANGDAARKAFVMNRVGDLGFLLGAFFLWYAMEAAQPGSGSLDYQAISAFFAGSEEEPSQMMGKPLVIAACALLFLGCTGKSAQIPLLSWLPDAMAGPTPVSALIHAATMVTSGIYLCARLADVFVCSGWVMPAIAVIGCATAVYGAIAGMVQWDIKKVLAYSTVSQLGFMFMAVGVGAFDVALFHVFTHAFFKAALFLGAGSVIHCLHHEQDLRRMGGLAKALPVTYSAMWFGWYAIIGLPLGSGFMSKDLIVERLFLGHADLFGVNLAPVIGVVALLAALLTAVYMTRMMELAFKGPSRVDPQVKEHLHEAPFAMSAPVLILGFGAMVAGAVWCGLDEKLNLFGAYLSGIMPHVPGADHSDHGNLPWIMAGVSVAIAFTGYGIGKLFFRNGPKDAEVKPLSGFAATWTHGIDALYTLVFVWPTKVLAWFLARVVDQLLLASLVRGLGELCGFLGEGYAAIQRGRLRVSLVLTLAGMVVLLAYLLAPVLGLGI